MTQEFHLSITSLGSDRYLIRTEDTAIGVPVAEAQVQWPVAEWLELTQPAMDDPVMELLRGKATVGDRAIHLQRLGTQLYTALFQDDAIRESWLRAQGIAQNRHEILRFRLGLKDSRLQRLPWEVLQQGDHPLTKRPKLTFARYLANVRVGLPDADPVADSDGVIRILMVIASPQDQDHLHLMQEVEHLQTLVGQIREDALPIKIDVLEQPDRNQLVQQLEHSRYQVLHYAGHSELSDQGGDLFLVSPVTGLTERLTGDDLAGILVNNHVSLAIFNSCRSGQTHGDDADVDWRPQNLVQALVSRGVPSVIAMAEQIPDEVAIAFTRLFYHNLRRGYPIDLSLSRARQGLGSAFGSDQHYWALPILYLQPEFDGYFTHQERVGDRQLDPDSLKGSDLAILSDPRGAVSSLALPSVAAPVTTPTAVSPTPLPQSPSEPVASGSLVLPNGQENSPPLVTLESIGQGMEDEEEAELAAFVKQLSMDMPRREDPPLPALADEVLLLPESHRGGMAIYDVLPEVSPAGSSPGGGEPTPASLREPRDRLPGAGTSVSPSMPLSPRDSGSSPSPLNSAPFPRLAASSQPERSIMVWFALGLVGIVAVMGLGIWALRHRGVEFPTVSPLPETPGETVPLSDGEMIAQAQQAIESGRYGDARQGLARLLTQELQGRSDASINDAVWALVSGTTQPDLLYIRGRLNWQAISQLNAEIDTTNQAYEQRSLAAQAKEAWNRTDDRFLEGRVARGFANLATGNLQAAIENLEAALRLYEQERQVQGDPTALEPADALVLHAYAGLVIAHMRAAGLNPAGLEEDDRLSQASPEEKALLEAQAENEKAIAENYFKTLRDKDPNNWMVPSALTQVNDAPETWHNWLWTPPLLNEWRRVYRYWDEG